MPIILGPLYVILKELWDKYTGKNRVIKKNIYNEKIKLIKDKLTLFYWPIYIKLCCLYHFNYNIIENNQLLYEIESYTPGENNNSNNSITNHKKCKNNKILKKNINHDDNYKRRKMIIQGKTFNSRKYGNDIERSNDIEHIIVNISDDTIWDNRSSVDSSNSDSFSLLKNSSDSSDMSDFTGDGIGIVNDLPQKTIIMEKVLVDNLDLKIIDLYSDIKNIILDNIAVGQPKSKLGRELTKFIRFSEMEQVVYNSNKIKNKKIFKSKDLGVKNNIKKLLKNIEINLFILQKEYNQMIKEFY